MARFEFNNERRTGFNSLTFDMLHATQGGREFPEQGIDENAIYCRECGCVVLFVESKGIAYVTEWSAAFNDNTVDEIIRCECYGGTE